MRVKRLATFLVLGIAVALAYAVRRRRGGPVRRAVPAGAGARGAAAGLDDGVTRPTADDDLGADAGV